jgi:hypothetical protein
MATYLLLIAAPAFGGDLAKIDRTIAKEPKYQSKPKYCLLVFGPEAKTRVWLVLDPDARLLYVDRNGNGDLREKGERVEPYEKNIDIRSYRAGDIAGTDGKPKYTNLSVVHLGTEKGAEGLAFEEGFSISVEVKGKAQYAQVKSFGDKPQNAPVVHFDGPLTFALFEANGQVFARGKEASALTVLIGTSGADRGTFASIACSAVPADVHPVAEIEFPGKGGKPIKAKVILDRRC